MTDRDRLAALLDPENAPARHGEWRPAHRPMGEESVELVDDDGCSLWVEPSEVAALVNMAVEAAGVTLSERPPVDPLRAAAQEVVAAFAARPDVDEGHHPEGLSKRDVERAWYAWELRQQKGLDALRAALAPAPEPVTNLPGSEPADWSVDPTSVTDLRDH